MVTFRTQEPLKKKQLPIETLKSRWIIGFVLIRFSQNFLEIF